MKVYIILCVKDFPVGFSRGNYWLITNYSQNDTFVRGLHIWCALIFAQILLTVCCIISFPSQKDVNLITPLNHIDDFDLCLTFSRLHHPIHCSSPTSSTSSSVYVYEIVLLIYICVLFSKNVFASSWVETAKMI